MSDDIAREIEKLSEDFGVDRKRSIGEIADELGVETHVIRFWEEQFPQIKPETGRGGRRYYYNKQIKVLKRIKKFLHEDGYTIAGLQKLLKKRKKETGKEGDLDVIIEADAENRAKNGENSVKIEQNKTKNQEFTLNDFIDPNINLSNQLQIQPAKQKSLDSKAKDEVISLIGNVSNNLSELKKLLKS